MMLCAMHVGIIPVPVAVSFCFQVLYNWMLAIASVIVQTCERVISLLI